MTKPDFISSDNKDYAKPEWWEGEYAKCSKDDQYEWFTGSYDDDFINLICSNIPSHDSKIVHLGCGISRIQETLYDKGYHDITNNDISESCIKLMKDSDTRGMKWDIVDILKPLPYDSESFDVALDKGTLDAIILEKADKFDIEDEVYEISEKYFSEVSRILKPGGIFIQISFGQPHFRRRLFQRDVFNWTVKVETIQPKKSFHFFAYICQKNK
ncbi:Endothelin-converting enzyme 2 [Tritrichomonas musculus]|uniref:Endothelin-converting enzyme 2 n=1 Tax=Tritrichomonas musculus TaxID=1915356 RepID=A0ABR2JPW1_9EUKA